MLAALCCSMTAASKKKVAPVRQDNSQPINGHWFVDLGLPSGLLWAATNVGAEFPADEGFYFAWGETKPKDRYVYSESQVINRYLQSKESVLARADDAATVNWSAPCRMPVQADIDELEKNCTMRDTLLLNASLDFVMCKLLKSKINGNEICIPVAGYREGANVYFHDKIGVYWEAHLMKKVLSPAHWHLVINCLTPPKKREKQKTKKKALHSSLKLIMDSPFVL